MLEAATLSGASSSRFRLFGPGLILLVDLFMQCTICSHRFLTDECGDCGGWLMVWFAMLVAPCALGWSARDRRVSSSAPGAYPLTAMASLLRMKVSETAYESASVPDEQQTV